ncbi:MAG: hypothetical protein JNM40_17690 [Myxococcales bacterium]|nr:hypothetical protein [Myxococcales bacterium]
MTPEIEIVESALRQLRDLQLNLTITVDRLTSSLATLREREALACARQAEQRRKAEQETKALIEVLIKKALKLAEQAITLREEERSERREPGKRRGQERTERLRTEEPEQRATAPAIPIPEQDPLAAFISYQRASAKKRPL